MLHDWTQRKPTHAMAAAPLLALLLFAGGCSEQESAAPEAVPSAAVEKTEPAAAMAEPDAGAAATAEAAAEATAAAATVDGDAIYKQSCMACHAAGVAGAPKPGDSEAWSPRIAKGTGALVQSVTNGLNAMPPKGGCMSCSEDELRGAVEYMVSQGS
jgi:cytochrome c5